MEYLTSILQVDAARRPWLNPSIDRARRFMNAARERAQNRPTLRDVTGSPDRGAEGKTTLQPRPRDRLGYRTCGAARLQE
jgi:hypothetical protein